MLAGRLSGSIASWLILAVCAAAGCGRDASHQASSMGEQLGENVTGFAKGVGRGIDKNLKVDIELSEDLQARGISTTVAKMGGPSGGDEPGKAVSIYVLSERACEIAFVAKAYDDQGHEIGRARSTIKFDADDAKYVNFEFPNEMDQQLVVTYRIGESTATTAEAQE